MSKKRKKSLLRASSWRLLAAALGIAAIIIYLTIPVIRVGDDTVFIGAQAVFGYVEHGMLEDIPMLSFSWTLCLALGLLLVSVVFLVYTCLSRPYRLGTLLMVLFLIGAGTLLLLSVSLIHIGVVGALLGHDILAFARADARLAEGAIIAGILAMLGAASALYSVAKK